MGLSIAGLSQKRRVVFFSFCSATLLLLFYSFYAYSWAHPKTKFNWITTPAVPSPIPRKIWQILLPMPGHVRAKGIADAQARSWLLSNPDHTFTRFGADGAEAFLQQHYPEAPSYLETFRALQNPALKSDFLRYLVLQAEGGVYTDLDTAALQPVDSWVPEAYRSRAKVLVGIEWDQRDERDGRGIFAYPVQFQQWTLAAAPHHPIFADIVQHVLGAFRNFTEAQNTTLDRVEMTNHDILMATGPGAWSGAVFRYLQKHAGVTTLRQFAYLKEPVLVQDVLIYPVNAFASGQDHSGAARWFTPKEALMKHQFKGSWRVQSS